MGNLVVYRQSLTIITKRWNVPRRKNGNDWTKIEHIDSVRDRHDGSLRGAIIRMKNKLEKIRDKDNKPIWKCQMTSARKDGYIIYHLICKKISKRI